MAKAAESTELAKRESTLDRLRGNPIEMRDMSFEELEQQAQDMESIESSQLGDGFNLVKNAKDKKLFVGVDLMVLDWEVWPSRDIPGSYFTSMMVKTRVPIPQLDNNTNFRINDGSTGIHRQLRELSQGGFKGVLRCRRGFTESNYTVTEPSFNEAGDPIIDDNTGKQKTQPKIDPITNQPMNATTFFLDTGL